MTAYNRAGFAGWLAVSAIVGGPALSQTAVTLSSLAPSKGPVGSTITLHGSGFSDNNTVHFGPGGSANIKSSKNGTVIVYTVPKTVSPCDLIGPACKAAVRLVGPGLYQISVTNKQDTSNTLQFEVTE